MQVKSSVRLHFIISLTYLLFMATHNYDKNAMSMKVGCFNYGREHSVLQAFLYHPEWPMVFVTDYGVRFDCPDVRASLLGQGSHSALSITFHCKACLQIFVLAPVLCKMTATRFLFFCQLLKEYRHLTFACVFSFLKGCVRRRYEWVTRWYSRVTVN